MPRRGPAPSREIAPDLKYKDVVVAKTINAIMKDGKKSTAEKIFYGAMDIIKERTGSDPLRVFKTAIDNIRPVVEVKSRRVGGASYQVPVDVRPVRRTSLAIRWLVKYASQRSGKSMKEKLAAEIMDAANGTGGAVRKKEETHRMAEANRAFAHYRW